VPLGRNKWAWALNEEDNRALSIQVRGLISRSPTPYLGDSSINLSCWQAKHEHDLTFYDIDRPQLESSDCKKSMVYNKCAERMNG
jgi:hypothetical protein